MFPPDETGAKRREEKRGGEKSSSADLPKKAGDGVFR
jgi:hypothetical protein